MLADGVRMRAYEAAIARTVHPGDVVVDLGTGTGVLALLAARAGAARVIGIDRDAWSLRQAKALARDNGFADRVEFCRADILNMTEFGTPVDVVLSELIGNEGIDEQIFAIYKHFLHILPRPPREIVPRALRLHAACMRLPEFCRRVKEVRTVCGLNMERLANALHHAHLLAPLPVLPASEPILLHEGHPGIDSLPEVFSCTWDFGDSREIDGIGMWFSSCLAEGVELTNDPRAESTHWSQSFFPVRLPGPVSGRTRFDLWPRMMHGRPFWKWRLQTTGFEFTADPDTLDEPDSLEEWLHNWQIARKTDNSRH